MSLFDYQAYQWTKGQRNWHFPYNNALEALKNFLGDKGNHNSIGDGLAANETEILAARNGEPSLLAKNQAQDTLFNIEHNPDGTHPVSASVGADWKISGHSVSYDSSNSFTIPTDVATVYVKGRRLKISLSSGDVFASVVSAVYSAPNTTVTIQESNLDNTLSAVSYGLISPGETGSMPNIPEIEVLTSNLMRAFEELQEYHGGSLLMESSWSDSFANPNEQGADEANSTGYLHDPTNTLYKGTDPGIGIDSDKNYGTENNFLQQEWTNANQSTSQATVTNGDTAVTLVSNSWPTNCANGRISFDSGSTWYHIATRTDSTNLELATTAVESSNDYDYIIRMSGFDSGELKLNGETNISYGPSNLDQTASSKVTNRHVGSIGSPSISSGGNTFQPSVNGKIDKINLDMQGLGTGPTDSMYLEIYATSGSPGSMFPTGPVLATSGTIAGSVLGGNAVPGTSVDFTFTGSNQILLTADTEYAWVFRRTGGDSSSHYYGMTNETSSTNSNYTRGNFFENTGAGGNNWQVSPNGYPDRYFQFYNLPETILGNIPISEYVSICDTESQNTNTSSWLDINSASVTENLNSQSVYYWLAFDPASGFDDGTEIKIFNSAGAVWRKIVRKNGINWEYNNDATNTAAEAWLVASTNDLLHAASQAISAQAANRMTGTELAAITDTEWEGTDGWSISINSIIRGVTLYSNSSSQNPSLSQYRINYDSERGAMDLRSKAYDPGFAPSEAYLWTRAEYVDIDGPGLFQVSRNGGSEWTAFSMVQQGLPLSGNNRILRGTVDLGGQTTGQDLRCRYQTSQGKDQFLHSWGLQAKP